MLAQSFRIYYNAGMIFNTRHLSKKKIKLYGYKLLSAFEVIILSALVGILSGVICALFAHGLIAVNHLRDAYYVFMPAALPLLGLAIIFLHTKFGKKTSAGMLLIFNAKFDKKQNVPLRMVPLAILATWMSHLGGASVGREGVACQIGAAIGWNIGELVQSERMKQHLIIAGIAGGFAGIFRTPAAAVCFSLEVIIAGHLFYRELVPSIIAAGSASLVSDYLGIMPERIMLSTIIETAPELTFMFTIKLIALAFLFGIVGRSFSQALKFTHSGMEKIFPNAYVRIAVIGFAAGVLLAAAHKGRYAGLSSPLSETLAGLSDGKTFFTYDWILKAAFTVVCLSAGFSGGELAPLLLIGSSFGAVIGPLFGIHPLLCAAFGYGAVFGAATNTLLAPIAIVGSVFGFRYIAPVALVCSVAYYVNGNRTVYANQRLAR